ncbi:MAG: orotidine-5-phosphate decarboxylase [Bacteroidota bacterium]|jgi:orotidine-5'-phosphate decarboxylase
MTRNQLVEQIFLKKSYLCIGLDTDLQKIPKHLLQADDPIFEFNRQIIDATYDLCVSYKPNLAFYESLGIKGWRSLEKTMDYISKNHFTIADAKRGDIGNTSKMYAKAFFETFDFDAVTVAPYMGADSVTPFLEFKNKWVILLALTSNQGSKDFQLHHNLYQEVLKKAQNWGTVDNLMFVVGATHPHQFETIRKIVPNHFLLVPGVGAQGGDLEQLTHFGKNKDVGLLVNSSRAILYASQGLDFAEKARAEALKVQQAMEKLLLNFANL